MKFLASATLLYAVSLSGAQAQDAVYVCTDDSGAREYRNTGATKGCKKLELSGTPAAAAPQVKRATGNVTANGAVKPAQAAAFPKVDSGTQQARDNERKLLLQDELNAEQGRLAALRAEFNQGEPERRGDERNYARYQERVAGLKDQLAGAERNVAALKRELGALR